jgi:hypothetical protein
VKIAAGCEHSAGITASGDLFAWGHGDGGRLGLGTNIQSFIPVKVEPLQQMKIRPISLHCGDKFTSIIGYPWDENLEAEKERMASCGSEKWELKKLQEWLIAEKGKKNNNQEEAERKDIKEEDNKETNSFSDLQDCFRWIDSVDEQTICENEESVILVLLSIIQADANHLLDPFQTNSSVIAASNAYFQDKEFSLEVCEDNFSNLHNLLELLTPLYSDHLNSYINKTFSKSINDQKTWKSLDWILLQIYLVLSNNLFAVSNIVKANKEKKLQKQTIKDGGKTVEETKSEEQQKEDYLLSFIYRRDNKVSNISPGKQMTSSGKFRSGDYSAVGRRSSVEDEENSRHSSSMYGDDEDNNNDDDEGGHNNNDDGSQSNYHNSDYNTTEGEGLASRDNAPSPAPSYESMENSLSGKRKSREEPTNRNMATTTTGAIAGERVGDDGNYSVQSSLQESDYFDENHSQNDNNDNGENLLGENDDEEEHVDPEGDVELQRALLSSIDSSRNLISSNFFTQSNLNLLKSIDKRRGKVSYLPKIRNMLNVISSLSFICIQQYYENYPQSDYGNDSSMKENIFRIYLTWESTQLATAAGFDCMYDETEQKSVLLQIIRSPESFLYIIPGVMKGLQKDFNNFEDIIDNLFPETFVSFFSDNNEDQQPQQQLDESQNSFESPRNEELENTVAIPSPHRNQNNIEEMNSPEETISSSHLSIEDIIKILENLLNLYERKQFKLSLWKQAIATDSNDIISRLYDQVQDSFSQLASRIISIPIQWFLKLGNNELGAFVTVNDVFASSEPWGTKMETVLQLLLSAIGEDLDKIIFKFFQEKKSTFQEKREKIKEKYHQLLSFENSFAFKMIEVIFVSGACANGRRNNQNETKDIFKICPISALLPFALRLMSRLEKSFEEAKSFLIPNSDQIKTVLFTTHNSENDWKRAAVVPLTDWFSRMNLIISKFVADALQYLSKPPKKWLGKELTLWHSGFNECFEFSSVPIGYLRKYIFDWEVLVWSSLTDRLLTPDLASLIPNGSSDSASLQLKSSADLITDHDISLLVRTYFTKLHTLNVFVLDLSRATQNPGQTEDHENDLNSIGADDVSLEWENIVYTFSVLASFFSDRSSDYNNSFLAIKKKKRTEVVIRNNDSFDEKEIDNEENHEENDENEKLAICDLFFFLMKIFFLSEFSQIPAPSPSYSARQENNRVSYVLLAIIYTHLFRDLLQDNSHPHFRTMIHFSRLDKLTFRLSFAERLFSEDIESLLSLPKAEFIDKIVFYEERIKAEMKRFDASNLTSSSPHILDLLDHWNASSHDYTLNAHSPEIFFLLLFFEHYSTSILKSCFLFEIINRNKEISCSLYSELFRKWEKFSEIAVPSATISDGNSSLFMQKFQDQMNERSLIYNKRYGYRKDFFPENKINCLEDAIINTDKISSGFELKLKPSLQKMTSPMMTFTKFLLDHTKSAEQRFQSPTNVAVAAGNYKEHSENHLLIQLKNDRLLILSQFNYLKGLTAFYQFSDSFSSCSSGFCSANILCIQCELLRWWEGLFHKLISLLQIHPFFINSPESVKDIIKSMEFFQENEMILDLLSQMISVFLANNQLLYLKTWDGDGITEKSEITDLIQNYCEEFTKTLGYVLTVTEFLSSNLSFYYQTYFMKYYWMIKDYSVQYLLCRSFNLELASPIISSNLCAPNGNFTIGFWIFLPEDLTEFLNSVLLMKVKNDDSEEEKKQANDNPVPSAGDENLERVHLLSRISESGDINMIDLLTKDPQSLDSFTLTVSLMIQKDTKHCYLELSVYVSSYGREEKKNSNNNNPTPSTAARKKVIHRKTLKSALLEKGKWSNIFLEVLQTSSPPPPTSESSSLPTRANSAELTYLILSVNNQIQAHEQMTSGEWPLHQNVMIGKLPSSLSLVTSGSRSPSSFVILADIVWVPTSLLFEEFQTKMNNYQYDFLLFLKNAHHQPNAVLSAYDSPVSLNFLPSEAIALMNTSKHSFAMILDLFKVTFQTCALSTASSSAAHHAIKRFFLSNALRFIQIIQRSFVTGDKTLQRRLLVLLKCMTEFSPELFIDLFPLCEEKEGDQRQNERKDEEDQNVKSISLGMSLVSSTKNLQLLKQQTLQQQLQLTVTQRKKIALSYLNFMKLLLSTLSTVMNPFFFTSFFSSLSSPSTMLSSILNNQIGSLQFSLVFPTHSLNTQEQSVVNSLWHYWLQRIYLQRIGIDNLSNSYLWSQFLFNIDENALIHDIAGLFSAFHQVSPKDCIHFCRQLLVDATSSTPSTGPTPSYDRMTLEFLIYSMGGGWLSTVNDGSVAIYNPRRFLLYRNHVSFSDESIFSMNSVVKLADESYENSPGISQYFIQQIQGSYEGCNYLEFYSSSTSSSNIVVNEKGDGLADEEKDEMMIMPYPVAVPSKNTHCLSITEMAATRDQFPVRNNKNDSTELMISLFKKENSSSIFSVSTGSGNSSNVLLDLLKAILLYTKKNEVNKPGSTSGSTNTKAKSSKSITEKSIPALLEAENEKHSSVSSGANKTDVHAMNRLILLLSYLRSLAAQCTEIPLNHRTVDVDHFEGNEHDENNPSLWKTNPIDENLFAVLMKDFYSILSLATLDPVDSSSTIFEMTSFKGIQVDVLKNLLREGDVSFLEKLITKLWKQFKFEDQEFFAQHNNVNSSLENSLQLMALQGEVQTFGTKVKAVSHFPSVKLLNVTLEKMSGRWFYECNLLTDGLMQIGWANSLFRCDPVCGQGVGDHVNSWAYDGLRMKKWNVSPDTYGKRWKLGDIVGVLVDMDLMEMRFYLNGEDLGAAFEDFSSYDIFPALSLNVRQCVRLNFGQFKFMYPPNLIDGKSFKPIIQALQDKKTTGGTAGKVSESSKLSHADGEDLNARFGMMSVVDDGKKTSSESKENSNNNVAGANLTPSSAVVGTSSNTNISEARRMIIQNSNNIRSTGVPSNLSPTESPLEQSANNTDQQPSSATSPLRPSERNNMLGANDHDEKSQEGMGEENEDDEDDGRGGHYDSEEDDDDDGDEEHGNEDPRYVLVGVSLAF